MVHALIKLQTLIKKTLRLKRWLWPIQLHGKRGTMGVGEEGKNKMKAWMRKHAASSGHELSVET